ncbi:MAG: hypothetical protein QM669_06005 [Siphonobacter sp.]
MIRWSSKRLIVNIILFGIFLLSAYYLWFPPIWQCQTISFRGYTEVANNVYVSNEFNTVSRDSLIRLINESHKRIRSFWGDQRGEATLIVCSSPANYHDFCLLNEGPGCSLGTPTGSWIIISPEGLNVDVIAHEMCHDEIFARLGWMKAKSSLPQWFDEGLALMVDYRYTDPDSARRYLNYLQHWDVLTKHGKIGPKIDEIGTVAGFFGVQRGQANPTRTAQSYVTAGMEVSRWLGLVGQPGLLRLVQQLRDGHSFDTAYRETEQYHRPKF